MDTMDKVVVPIDINYLAVTVRVNNNGKIVIEEVTEQSTGTKYANIPNKEQGIEPIHCIIKDVHDLIKANKGVCPKEANAMAEGRPLVFDPWVHKDNLGRTDLVPRVAKAKRFGDKAQAYLQMADPNAAMNSSIKVDKTKGLVLR